MKILLAFCALGFLGLAFDVVANTTTSTTTSPPVSGSARVAPAGRGTAFALIASIKFHKPDFMGDCPFFTYGHVHAAHLNALAYGFAAQRTLRRMDHERMLLLRAPVDAP